MMSPSLPDCVIVNASGAPFYEGIAVILTFGMTVKNDYNFIVFLDANGRAEIKKAEYLSECDRDRKLFLMDYTNPRAAFSGSIKAEIMTKPELEAAIKACDRFRKVSTYPEGHRERLQKALSALDKEGLAVEKMSVAVEQIP